MSEKLNCLLEKYHRLKVRIYVLQRKSREIRNLIMEEDALDLRKNATK